jgi:sulfoquinovose isomerase
MRTRYVASALLALASVGLGEASGGAPLWRVTGESEYEHWYQPLRSFTGRFLIDRGYGGWYHQLDSNNWPIDTIWKSKPDAYHVYQATLFAGLDPRHGLAVSLLADEGVRL